MVIGQTYIQVFFQIIQLVLKKLKEGAQEEKNVCVVAFEQKLFYFSTTKHKCII